MLHHSNKLALLLAPGRVVARVSRPGDDPTRDVAHLELERAQHFAAAGCPVGLPHTDVAPVVHSRDGFAVTLWLTTRRSQTAPGR